MTASAYEIAAAAAVGGPTGIGSTDDVCIPRERQLRRHRSDAAGGAMDEDGFSGLDFQDLDDRTVGCKTRQGEARGLRPARRPRFSHKRLDRSADQFSVGAVMEDVLTDITDHLIPRRKLADPSPYTLDDTSDIPSGDDREPCVGVALTQTGLQ